METYCYRVEPRTVIPGIKKDISIQQGWENVIEITRLYLIVEGSTEFYIDNHGQRHTRTHTVMIDDYFVLESDAQTSAQAFHKKVQCDSPSCGWNSLPAQAGENFTSA